MRYKRQRRNSQVQLSPVRHGLGWEVWWISQAHKGHPSGEASMVPALAPPRRSMVPQGLAQPGNSGRCLRGTYRECPPLSWFGSTPSPPLAFITKPQLDPLLLLVFLSLFTTTFIPVTLFGFQPTTLFFILNNFRLLYSFLLSNPVSLFLRYNYYIP